MAWRHGFHHVLAMAGFLYVSSVGIAAATLLVAVGILRGPVVRWISFAAVGIALILLADLFLLGTSYYIGDWLTDVMESVGLGSFTRLLEAVPQPDRHRRRSLLLPCAVAPLAGPTSWRVRRCGGPEFGRTDSRSSRLDAGMVPGARFVCACLVWDVDGAIRTLLVGPPSPVAALRPVRR